ncbi:MAG: TorF family putative porin, partial [Pseudomonadota bacterium]
GGYKFDIAKDVTMDVGYLRYEYVGSDALTSRVGTVSSVALAKPSTNEIYVGLSSGAFSAKHSYSTGDTFGVVNSKGSTFTELNWSQEVMPKITLNAQIARQTYKNNGTFTYSVYKFGGTYDFGDGWNAGAYYKTTNAVEANYTYLGRDWSKGRLVAFVSKSF